MWRQFSRPSNPRGQLGFFALLKITRRQLYWWAIKDISTAYSFVYMLVTVPNDKWGHCNTTGTGLAIGIQQFHGPVKSTYTRQIKTLSIHQINNQSARLWLNALKTGFWSSEVLEGLWIFAQNSQTVTFKMLVLSLFSHFTHIHTEVTLSL